MIAHVDDGKTNLVDKLLEEAGIGGGIKTTYQDVV